LSAPGRRLGIGEASLSSDAAPGETEDVKEPHPLVPAPLGWSATMKRWLAQTTHRMDPAVRWVAVIEDGSGSSQVSLDEIQAVRVEDLSQVLEHRIARIVGCTSHVIRFIGGGELRYACNHRGQVIELSATGIRGTLSPSRIVTFGVLGLDRSER
jgi:hypothetical protein